MNSLDRHHSAFYEETPFQETGIWLYRQRKHQSKTIRERERERERERFKVRWWLKWTKRRIELQVGIGSRFGSRRLLSLKGDVWIWRITENRDWTLEISWAVWPFFLIVYALLAWLCNFAFVFYHFMAAASLDFFGSSQAR